ncbi:transcriptional adapter 2-beta-like [Halichondria panicea]|uniref:transcriptional adapter 2-beta-like n=1 Tax=Halichondria panicea TaxID=6063 RepID=UPI00312BB155
MADDDAQRYHCDYCGCDITLRLKCYVCPDFDLCLECFASGAEAGGHNKGHSYQLIDEGSFPLLVDDWGAIEEVLLLDAVEQDGFGNWDDIAAHVVTKTARNCREHYNDMYINSTIGEGVISSTYHETVLEDHGGEIPPSPANFTPVKLEHAEQLELGYMPLRDDFEKEYDNDAEALVSTLTVNQDDDEVETALKQAHIDMYNKRLIERIKKKRVAKQHNLIAGKQKQSAFKRKMPKEERELRSQYKLLARLMEPEEYETFLSSLKKEKQLRERIRQLKRYRKNGLTKTEDCPEFDSLSKEESKKLSDTDGADSDSDQDLILPQGIDLLSASERKLCNSLSMKPREYMSAKTEVIKTSAMKRSGCPVKPKVPKHLPSEHKQKLQQYFTRSGWLG